MSANRPAPTDTIPPTGAPVDTDPTATDPSRINRIVTALRESNAMSALLIRTSFDADVTKRNADIIRAVPPTGPDLLKNFVGAHRTMKGTEPKPPAGAPDPETVPRSGAERRQSLLRALEHDELIEVRTEMDKWEGAYPFITADRKTFKAEMKGWSHGRKRAAWKARRSHGRLDKEKHHLYHSFGLDPHEVEAEHAEAARKAAEMTPEKRAAESINTLARLQGDIVTIKDKVHKKSRSLQEYRSKGTLAFGNIIPRYERELTEQISNLRSARVDLNQHIYTHLRDYPTAGTEQQPDGSILVRGENINNTYGNWLIHEDGSAIQLSDDGNVLARYRPNGLRYYVDKDRMKQKLEQDILGMPNGPEILKKNYTDTGRDIVGENTDFEAKLQDVDVQVVRDLRAETQRLQDLILQKRRNGEDVTDDIAELRNATESLNMAMYDYLYGTPNAAERPYEGVVVLRHPEFINGVWGEWSLSQDGSGNCHDQDGQLVARFNPDGSIDSFRPDPYAHIDTLPPRDPSGSTLDEVNTQIAMRQEGINEAREFIAVNHGNTARRDDVIEQQNFIADELERIRGLREDYNVTLYQELRANLPADAQILRDGTIIANTTMNGYTGRWVISENGSAMYLGRNVDTTNQPIMPIARFHRNGYRYL